MVGYVLKIYSGKYLIKADNDEQAKIKAQRVLDSMGEIHEVTVLYHIREIAKFSAKPFKQELKDFKELQWQSTHFKKKFIIEEGVEKNLDLARDTEPDPLHNKKTYQQSLEKYETPDEKNAVASEPGSQQPSGPKGDGNVIEISPSANDAMSDRNATPPRFDPKLDEVVTIPMDN